MFKALDMDALILQIHAAPQSAEGWHGVIRSLQKVLDAPKALVHSATPKSYNEFWFVNSGFSSDTLETYGREWGRHDEWARGAVENGRTGCGQVSLEEQMVERRELMRTPFFNEFLRPSNIDRHLSVCLATPKLGEASGPVILGFYRDVGMEAFSAKDAAIVSRLSPHLVLATQNYRRLTSVREANAILESSVTMFGEAVLAVDRTGHIVFANLAAEAALRSAQWITSTEGRITPAKGVQERVEFRQSLERLSRGLASVILLTDTHSGQQAVLSAMPMGNRESAGTCRKSGLVWLVPLQSNVSPVTCLARLYGLTTAEQRLLARLAEGNDLREAAEALSLSIHTVRHQLKAVFRRTGCRSQAHLLTYIARLSTVKMQCSG